MVTRYVKPQQHLRISDGAVSNFSIGKSKTETTRSVTSIKTRYKLSFLSPSASNLSLIRSSPSKDSLLPEIATRHSTDEDRSSTPQKFASPKISQRLAPVRFKRTRNAQSLDLRSIRHQNSKKDDSFEYLKAMQEPSNRDESNYYADQLPKKTVGAEAVNNFYSHYKRLDKIVDQNSFKDIRDSIYTSFLKCEEDLALFPSKIGLIKERGDKRHILIE